jgi:hypothetical protein
MGDVVIERTNPVNVMKLNDDEQALLDEIEIAPVQAKRAKPPPRRVQFQGPPQPQQPAEPDLDAFINPTKQTQQAPRFQQQPMMQEEDDMNFDDEPQYDDPDMPDVGGGGGGDGGEQPSDGYSSIDDEKADILNKLSRLAKKGFAVNKRLTVYSSIQELRTELKRIMYGIEVEQSVKFSRRMLVACVSGAEFLNKRYNPFEIQLDGWSESVMENLDDYDGVFEELYGKYKTKMNVAPEVKLMMMLGGSAMMFHLTNSMFKAAVPNMSEVMKQNPELVKSMVEAVQNTKSAPATASAPSVDANGRREMKGPGFDLASLMGGIMMPPPPPVNTSTIQAISDDDSVSDIVSVSGASSTAGGDIKDVRLKPSSKRPPRANKKEVSI